MKMFRENNIELGNVKVGKKVIIKFKAINKLPKIQSLSSSCGCGIPILVGNNEIKVVYKPMPIPHHLTHLNSYDSSKNITVVYVDGSKDVLTFHSKVFK